MKILSIRFLNLNSLKGEHHIEFNKSPFLESGLFAITGPTGAGKTTILDAITLALYGRVHRHGTEADESMTRFTAESFSEVEFEIKQQTYKAKWSQKRAYGNVTGKLQGVNMELSDLNTGKIIISSPSLIAVYNKIIEICGLDYSQFLRSVMLSQGDFTRFLKSSENERSELLEKITDTAIYADVSKFIYKKTDEENKKLSDLKMQMNNVEFLSGEAKKLLLEEVATLNQQGTEYTQQKQDADQKITWLSNIANLSSKKDDCEQRLEAFKLTQLENQPQFLQLQEHNKAIVHKPALAEIDMLVKSEAELQKAIDKTQEQLPDLKSIIDQLEEQHFSAIGHYDTRKKDLTILDPLLDEVIAKDSELRFLKEQLIKTTERADDEKLKLEKASHDHNQKKDALDKCKAAIKQTNKWLEENKFDEDLEKEQPQFLQYKKELNSFEESISKLEQVIAINVTSGDSKQEQWENIIDTIKGLKKEIEDQLANKKLLVADLENALKGSTLEKMEQESLGFPVSIGILKDLARIAKVYSKTEEKRSTAKEAVDLLLQQQSENQIILNNWLQQKEAAEQLLDELQRLVESEIRIQKFDEDRLHLQPESPCPLCGSEEHPWVANNYQSHVTDAEKRRKNQDNIVKKLVKDVGTKSIEINTVISKGTGLNNELEQYGKDNVELKISFNQTNQYVTYPIDITNETNIISLLAEKEETYSAIQVHINKIKALNKQESDMETAIQDQGKLLLKTESEKLVFDEQLLNIAKERNRLSQEKEDLIIKQTAIKQAVNEFCKKFNLQIKVNDLNSVAIELNIRVHTYKTATATAIDNNVLITRIEAEFKAATQKEVELTSTEKIISLLVKSEESIVKEREAQRRVLFEDKDPVAERKKLNEELGSLHVRVNELSENLKLHKGNFTVQETRLKEWKKSFSEKEAECLQKNVLLLSNISEQGITTIEALKENILSEEEANAIHKIQDKILTDINITTGLIESTLKELDIEVAKNLTVATVETLTNATRENELRINELNQQIGEKNNILKRDAEDVEKFDTIAKQSIIQQKEYDRWKKLCDLVGSENGRKFSRFAQGLTLAHLTDLANIRLQKFSDRYRILKSPDKDLELQIVDSYQADVIRPMTTLSGGESFLVSLALALGLSDLASRKVQIQSLFIDEGFGTLDADTLELALSALENLQASGKMIGIISHVEALKEIPVQINVNKLPGGYSKIIVKGYGIEKVASI